MPSPTPTLDLFGVADRLNEELRQPAPVDDAVQRWFATIEIHVLAMQAMVAEERDGVLDSESESEILWESPQVAPLVKRLKGDREIIRCRAERSVEALRKPNREYAEVRVLATELVQAVLLHRAHHRGIFHEAFDVDHGGPNPG